MRTLFYYLLSSLLSTAAFSEPKLLSQGSLTLSETQYWVYTYEANQLSFNNPWDEIVGDSIQRDPAGLPPYAVSCATQSFEFLQNTLSEPATAAKLQDLKAKGATEELILLVNVTPLATPLAELRKLDRDAYFSHWTDVNSKPHLARSDFKRGQWVWEVIAGPQTCVQPNPKELLRYLDYALTRLSKI